MILVQGPASEDGQRSVAEGSVRDTRLQKARGKTGLAPKENALAKATEEKQNIEALYGFGRHWETRQRERDFNAKMAMLERVARRVGGYVMDKDCMAKSQELFDLVEKLKDRTKLFDTIRVAFHSLIRQGLTDTQRSLLQEADTVTLVNIIVSSLQMLARCHHMDLSIRGGSEEQCNIDVWDCRMTMFIEFHSFILLVSYCWSSFPGSIFLALSSFRFQISDSIFQISEL